MSQCVSLLTILLFIFCLSYSDAQMVPAVFVFGDSLVDVGNNNHLELSLAKADFPHNGLDFPRKKATGRFSNGKNAADFIAEKLGLPTSPPYLSLRSLSNNSNNAFTMGVSFASGGAGILNETNKLFRLYDLGARKFFVVGTGAIGCCPTQRNQNKTGECNHETNYWSSKYNEAVISLLKEIKAEIKEINYSFFDTYSVFLNFIEKPSLYGFTEVKAACCGLGNLNAQVPCLPISTYCTNRTDHVFWDLYHPTEATSRIIVDTIFSGSQQYAYPISVKQLISM
ncbi:hypothetical protein GIB67_011590 [Kingdonia uniflora]|uniref:GDSL esterase/lipase n=1 Tax=Kingdonia uniflora TaxID=39325 RepID=A0A7J7NLY9_9MAGN|nr:hypothetical protein GIB67_011590 [Kingdonia uniflora]